MSLEPEPDDRPSSPPRPSAAEEWAAQLASGALGERLVNAARVAAALHMAMDVPPLASELGSIARRRGEPA